jgi:hypothetical protein
VSTLETFSRLDRAILQLVDVHEGLGSVLDLLSPHWGDRIRVRKRFGRLPRIECAPHELNQVFMTLLGNAAEAIVGRGTITVTTGTTRDGVYVTVSDTGRGIPPDRLSRIFDVGLSEKGTRVRMRSRADKGTTFEIHLPFGRSHDGSDQNGEPPAEKSPALTQEPEPSALTTGTAEAPPSTHGKAAETDGQDWSRIDELFDAALDLPPEDRSRWLDAACNGNGELRARVEELLSLTDRQDDLMVPRGAMTGPLWEDLLRELGVDR